MDSEKMKRRIPGSFWALMFMIDAAMPFFCAQTHEEDLVKLLGLSPLDPVREFAFNLFVQEPRQRVADFAKNVRAFVRDGTVFKARNVAVVDSVVAASCDNARDTLDPLLKLVREWMEDLEAEPGAFTLKSSTHAKMIARAMILAVKARLTILPRHIADRAYQRWIGIGVLEGMRNGF